MGASVVISATRFQNLLNRVGGPGERLLRRKAERVAALARVYSSSNGSIPEGIIVGPFVDKTMSVISTNPNTLFVHNGTRKHIIRPKRAGGWLRFEVGGRVVFAREVAHPGNKANPFLANALRDAG
jgi:hypothetical protein